MLVWRLVRKTLCASVLPFVPFNWLRIMGYRLAGFQIGRNVFIGMHVYMDDMHPQRTVIEDDVTISYRVTFACHGPRSSNTKLVLRKGSYVGCNAILLGGFSRGDTEIGPYASVGAGALVNRSVPPLATVVGQPARVIRTTRMPWGSDQLLVDEVAQEYCQAQETSPMIEPAGGKFEKTVVVQIHCPHEGVTMIRFTMDESDPTEDSKAYTGKLSLNRTGTVRARAFKAGHLPSAIVTARFEISG
jgi:serine acetyltransferase